MDFNLVLEKLELGIDGKEKLDALSFVVDVLKEEVYHYDWVGIYELDLNRGILVLGPYVGNKTDHLEIAVGNGVCGQVAEKNSTMIVQDVSEESNYISCSVDVQSEVVVPIKKLGKFVAEIDIDSRSIAPFTNEDQCFLEQVSNLLSKYY
ncbi:GAF domain-containing protein [Halosquirtibacter laminarini]|uniref:GAF domain-containing protein n=1 Tax=Halosquirtibacter laminarini TaxID=3374600 RepID=A0AC61NQV1_9BACT|nr:GAF domain-containing protein [Prolixibacteraceae bacterium]